MSVDPARLRQISDDLYAEGLYTSAESVAQAAAEIERLRAQLDDIRSKL